MSEPPEHSGTSSDAFRSLNQIFELYAHADSYHIESVEETRLDSEFSRLWTKSLTTSIVAPGNRYHFETNSDHGTGLQISDGKTEWIYYPPFQQYIQHAVPSTGPSRIESPTAPGLYSLTGAQNTVKSFSNVQKLIRAAVYTPDEGIEVNGKVVICNVIQADGELPGISAHITTRFIFWIDKQTKVIRKMTEHREGPLHPTEPGTKYVMEREALFPVADLNVPSFPDRFFAFEPPMTASLVKEFEDRMTAEIRQFVGKKAPEISLKAADGKTIPLKSFQGKPLLLDVWATWCAPCVESLPMIEKLYNETVKNGLVLLSIDEDEEVEKASEFWTNPTSAVWCDLKIF